MSEFLAALRRQASAKEIVGSIVVFGALVAFTDVTPSAAVIFAWVFVLVAVVSALGELPGVKNRALNAIVFSAGTLCGIYLMVTDPSPVMGGFTLIVGWLTLDAMYDTVYGIERTEPSKSDLDEMGATEASRLMYRAGQVGQALKKSPTSLSVPELVTRTGLSEAEVRESLSMLDEAEVVRGKRERYELDEDQSGLIRSTISRIARPFSLFTPSR